MSFSSKESDRETYIGFLLKEAASRCREYNGPIRTVYIGGGTPSLLSPVLFRRLMDGLRDYFHFDHIDEFTVEANPGTVSGEWLEAAVASGVTRLSFGMQAFQNNLLDVLGRVHRFDDVVRSVNLARLSGVDNINLDLIFGIPGQTKNNWMETIDAALSLHTEHISAYGLIPEEGTPIYQDITNGRLFLPEPETEREMYWDALKKLRESGYVQYEISNFARPGYECRHNIGYWTQIPYIGLGVSAASMHSVRIDSEGMSYLRRMNPQTLESYRRMIEKDQSYATTETIGPHESCFETMMLGLRMNEGVGEKAFQRMHGISMEKRFGERLHNLERKGLLIHDSGRWRLTERGFDIQNSVLLELMD